MNDIRRLFDHMYWADDRLAALLRDLDVDPDAGAEIARLYAHLIAAEQIWLARSTGGEAPTVPVWPERSIADSMEAAGEVRAGYRVLLASMDDDQLSRVITYRNSKGVAFETKLGDILLHVALHGSYHRGQIAAAVRRGGGDPVNTDFISWVREGG